MKHPLDDPFERWLHQNNHPTPSLVDACRWVAAELDAIDAASERGAAESTMRGMLLEAIDGLKEFADAKDPSSTGAVSRTASERQVFVVERWDAHHDDWRALKEFNVFHEDDAEVVRGQVRAYMAENAPGQYGGKDSPSKLRARRFVRCTRVVSRLVEEFQS